MSAIVAATTRIFLAVLNIEALLNQEFPYIFHAGTNASNDTPIAILVKTNPKANFQLNGTIPDNISLACFIPQEATTIIAPIRATFLIVRPPMYSATLLIANNTTPSVIATKIAVKPCINDMGVILLKIQEAKTIPPATAPIKSPNNAPLVIIDITDDFIFIFDTAVVIAYKAIPRAIDVNVTLKIVLKSIVAAFLSM